MAEQGVSTLKITVRQSLVMGLPTGILELYRGHLSRRECGKIAKEELDAKKVTVKAERNRLRVWDQEDDAGERKEVFYFVELV